MAIPMRGGFSGYVPLNPATNAVAERNLMTGDMRAINGRPVAVPGSEQAPLGALGEDYAPVPRPAAAAATAKSRRRAKIADSVQGVPYQDITNQRGPASWWQVASNVIGSDRGFMPAFARATDTRRELEGEDAATDAYSKLFAGGRTPSTQELAAFVGEQPYATEGQQGVASAYLSAGLRDQDSFRAMTPQEKARYGIDPKTPAQIDVRTGKVQTLNDKGVTINMPSEGERGGAAMLEGIRSDYGVFSQNFDALTDPAGQYAQFYTSKIPLVGGTLARFQQTPEYQNAYYAIFNIMSAYNKVISGTAVSDEELRRRVELTLPMPGDDPPAIAAKRARIEGYVNAIEKTAGRAAGPDVRQGQTQQPTDIFNSPDDVPEGSTVEDDKTGQRFIKKNGKLVPVQ